MILSIKITDDETEKSYFVTQKDGRLWVENGGEEGMGVSEAELFEIIDKWFSREL